MLSKGTTWPPHAATKTRVISGATPKAIADRREGARSPSEAAPVKDGETRPAESDWESVIDRATD